MNYYELKYNTIHFVDFVRLYSNSEVSEVSEVRQGSRPHDVPYSGPSHKSPQLAAG